MGRRSVVLVVLLALAGPRAAAGAADPFQEMSLFRPSQPATAPEFIAPRLGSGSLSLRDHRGQVVFLNFWATWCPPCKDEMPSMERVYRRFKNRGFTFPIGLDPTLEVANLHAIRGLPASFPIARSGRTAAIAIGPRDWDGPAAHAVVESLLK